jgi:tripartite-type tricarboxylate transporter receptor subunit TctC
MFVSEVEPVRAAFAEMVKNSDFITEAKKIGLDPEPLSGIELQKLVTDTLDASGEAVKRLREVTQTPR